MDVLQRRIVEDANPARFKYLPRYRDLSIHRGRVRTCFISIRRFWRLSRLGHGSRPKMTSLFYYYKEVGMGSGRGKGQERVGYADYGYTLRGRL